MSATQNLIYSVVQVAHNLGAVATVGGSLVAFKTSSEDTRRKLAWLALSGWGTQAASGAAFGAVSFYFYHQFPDISGIAANALAIKMGCAALGFIILATYLYCSKEWTLSEKNSVWLASSLLAITALCSAAFLHWFA
jgi:hypothetical protein